MSAAIEDDIRSNRPRADLADFPVAVCVQVLRLMRDDCGIDVAELDAEMTAELPADGLAMIARGYAENDRCTAMVFYRGGLPDDERADLLGYLAALATMIQDDMVPVPDGLDSPVWSIRAGPTPVAEAGPAKLAQLILTTWNWQRELLDFPTQVVSLDSVWE